MIVRGSTAQTDDSGTTLLVEVDELPSLRLEDASDEVWNEARSFYGETAFEMVGTLEANDQVGYTFAEHFE